MIAHPCYIILKPMETLIFVLWYIISIKLVNVTQGFKTAQVSISYRINKYGDIYHVQSNSNGMAVLSFWNMKSCKWYYAVETVDLKFKVLKIRRFKVIYAITLAHNIKIDTFVHKYCKLKNKYHDKH